MFHNKLQSADQLKKRNWKGEVNCQLCGGLEDMNHIKFKCVSSKFVWVFMKEAFGWAMYPSSFEDFLSNWVGGGGIQEEG
jgi:hypothetical protein